MQTIKPASKQVFAKPTEVEKKTKSGFLLSDAAIDKPKTAQVINVGSDITWLKQGDTIVYKQYTTNDIKLNDEDFLLIAEEDVLGTVLEVET